MRLSLRHRLMIVAGLFMYPPIAFLTVVVLADVIVPAPYRIWEAAPDVENSQSASENPSLVSDTRTPDIVVKRVILDIGGREVEVDKRCLTLSPEQQKVTIHEIESALRSYDRKRTSDSVPLPPGLILDNTPAPSASKPALGPWEAYQAPPAAPRSGVGAALSDIDAALAGKLPPVPAARKAPTSIERAPSLMPLWLRFGIAALISWGIAAALIYPIAWVIDAARLPRQPGDKAPI